MTNDRIEYRFVLDAYTPDTIPQAKLAEYLADLALLYGEEAAVHFVGVEESSLAIVSAIDIDADPEVSERIQAADTESASPDIRKAYQSLVKRIHEDSGSAFIKKGQARVLEFPSGERQAESPAFGPFWQAGHISGIVILLGGKTDRVSVKVQDANGETHTCKAEKSIAKRLRAYLFEGPVRLSGQGRWRRETTGRWRLEQFDIADFAPLDDDPLTDTIARLRAIEADWKQRPDPLAELEDIRRGN